MRNVRLSTNHCFSMFQHATHTIVVLDIAGFWASEAYGLCRLCAYFCARKLVRARSYWPYRSTDRCSKHATKSTVALDAAWPYGLCCLRAHFCARKFFRARSYVVVPCCARGGDRVPVLGAVAGCWVCVVSWLCAWWKQGAGCWLCACGAVSWRAGAGCWLCAWRTQGVAGLLVLVVCAVQIGCWCRVLALACSGDTPRCIARKNWSCCQCRVQPRKNHLHAFAIWGLCWSNFRFAFV